MSSIGFWGSGSDGRMPVVHVGVSLKHGDVTEPFWRFGVVSSRDFQRGVFEAAVLTVDTKKLIGGGG